MADFGWGSTRTLVLALPWCSRDG
uniref:Uncharacterized protein n=1 Tax=Arundo donax TaxID=35708 RepID=A0A0A9GUI9_ARUDO